MIKVKCRGYEGALARLDSDVEVVGGLDRRTEVWMYEIEVEVSLTETVTILAVGADEIEFI